MLRVVVGLSLAVLIGCPDSSDDRDGSVPETSDDVQSTTAGDQNGTSGASTTGDDDVTTGGDTQSDTDGGTDVGSTTGGPGSEVAEDFGQTCAEHEDCDDGICLKNAPDGPVCTSKCGGECPDKWECQAATGPDGDLVYICKPLFVKNCLACETSGDCAGDPCMDFPPEGQFCLRECTLQEPCPAGYICKPVSDELNICHPSSASCLCPPEDYGKQEACTVQNMFGICTGFSECGGPGGWSDCNALEPTAEICDGEDNDCDGELDESTDGFTCEVTNEFGSCPGEAVCKGPEGIQCTAAEPVPETCDGQDNDCDGKVDEAGAVGCTDFYQDVDKDGLGNSNAVECRCSAQAPFTAGVGGDCNDLAASVGPGKPEVCNSTDDNCDGLIDGENAIGCLFYYRDDDLDGYGLAQDQKCLCAPEPPYTAALSGDCDDDNKLAYPTNAEKCSGFDSNCNGHVDEPEALGCQPYLLDVDGDGFGVTGLAQCLCEPGDLFRAELFGDCEDNNSSTFPNAPEVCDGVDNSCNGNTDEDCDLDADGYCNALKPIVGAPLACPKGGGDCNDLNHSVNPGAAETCNSVDDNCNNNTDEGVKSPCGGCTPVCTMGSGTGMPVPFSNATLEGGAVLNEASLTLMPNATNGCLKQVYEGWETQATQWMQVGLTFDTPENTTVTLRARAAEGLGALATKQWTPIFGPYPPALPPANLSQFGKVIGRFLEVEVCLTTTTPGTAPVVDAVQIVATPFQ